ncbi:bifunctional serine/threonine-protein kinase/glutamate ABC transporter substrate-binding protein [Streptodolium elevatio]|uniref:non-specific serine/threonine protein kinase n=1 Tax=Streptodolium elevatio TaxID=3157996 RepID=A0ABV3DS78_9ACTN
MSEGDVGRVLSQRYRLSRSLGRGGMGEVWLAVDTALGREVAVKELLLPASLDETAQRSWLERSKREATAAARIRHENVVTVHDVFEEDGRPWIVMELVISRSLAEVVRSEGRLDYAEAARIGLDVLRALRAAHAKGVLHRDVKPANVLLGLDGRVVLTDFGIATFVDAPQVTQIGELLGTPGYLAPERAERFAAGGAIPAGGRHDAAGDDGTAGHATVRGSEDALGMSGGILLDPASDLWSLGATLYEMVEGRPPFSRSSAVEVVDAVVNHDPLPMRHSGALEPVITGLLRKDPVMRMDGKEAEEQLIGVIQEALAPTWGGEAPAGQRKPGGAAEAPGTGAYRAGVGTGHTATHRATPRGVPDGRAGALGAGTPGTGTSGTGTSGTGTSGQGAPAGGTPGTADAAPARGGLAPHGPGDAVDATWAGDGPGSVQAPEPGASGGRPGDGSGGGPGSPGGPGGHDSRRSFWRSRTARIGLPVAVALVLIAVSVTVAAVVGGGEDKRKQMLADLREQSPTYQAMLKRGYMLVGVKPDQPGLSQKGPDGEYAGFDDEIARMIAADLGFPGKLRFVDVETQGREYRISSGQVDLIVASYTINPERLERVSFAGPYYVAGQDFLVRKDDPGAARPEDLADDRICVVRGSTSAERIGQKFPAMQVEERGKYSECVDELLNKKVRGVSTDDTILAGFVAKHPAELRVLGSPFSAEPYGVGLSRGDTVLAKAVCEALNRHIANGDWQRAYDATLGPLGLLAPRPPKCTPHMTSADLNGG